MKRSTLIVGVGGVLLCFGSIANAGESYEPWPGGTGVELGTGWDSRRGEKKLSTCIEFSAAQANGQLRSVEFGEASDRSSLMRTFSVSTKAKARSILGGSGSASASASFSRKTKIEHQNITLAVDARIHDNVRFVVPKGRGKLISDAFTDAGTVSPGADVDAMQPGPVLVASSSPSLDGALATMLAKNASDRSLQHYLVDASSSNTIPQVMLTKEALKLARTRPQEFRATCGDSFVSTIRSGVGLQGIYSIRTRNREERQDIRGKVGGSFGTFSGSATSRATMERLQNESRTDIRYIQLGGSGTPVATDHKGFLQLVADIGKDASPLTSAPYEIGLIPYSDLPGFPIAAQSDGALGTLTDQYLRLETLDNEVNDMLQGDAYFFDTRITRDGLKRTQDAMKADMAKIRSALTECENASGKCAPPAGVAMHDYGYRMHLPVLKLNVRVEQSLATARAELDRARHLLSRTERRRCWRESHALNGSLAEAMGGPDGPGGPNLATVCGPNPAYAERAKNVERLEARLKALEAKRDSTLDRFHIWVEEPSIARCENREFDLCLTHEQLDAMRDEMLEVAQ